MSIIREMYNVCKYVFHLGSKNVEQMSWVGWFGCCYKNLTKMSEMTDPEARPRVRNNDIIVPARSLSAALTNLKREKYTNL